MIPHIPLVPGGPHGVDPLVLLLMAMLLDAAVARFPFPFSRIRHPVRVIGDAVAWADRKLNREQRSEGDRFFRGVMTVLAVVGAAILFGTAVAWLSGNHPFGWIVEFPLIVALLAARSLHDHVRAVQRALEESLNAGRLAVSHIVGRDPDQLDQHGVARAAIESLAENFSDGVVAPVFWYALFGLPGLLACKAVNTLDSMIGHMTPRHRAFGRFAAWIDTAINYLPARFAGLFIAVAAAFVARTDVRFAPAVKTMLRDASKHRSVNAGWPEGAMAGALGLALAGPRRYRERVVDDPWIGDGSARATALDIRRALRLYVAACFVLAAFVGLLALAR
jgi:adenosylcobinamide-phosphate synthase